MDKLVILLLVYKANSLISLDYVIKSCIEGVEKSQRQLYEQYRRPWYMISLRYGKNKAEAEDIFQEGLIQIYTSLYQYDATKSQFITWSSKVMVHAALLYLKENSWQSIMGELSEAQEEQVVAETIFEKLAVEELTLLIQQLPMGYRLVFNMYAIEGYSHSEIAKALDISEGTSKSQLFKARKLLKKKVESQLKSSHNG